MINNAISADDFLPLFTYVLVHAGVPHLFLLKELMVSLISNEDAYGECGKLLLSSFPSSSSLSISLRILPGNPGGSDSAYHGHRHAARRDRIH
jgi:hypothetical protein